MRIVIDLDGTICEIRKNNQEYSNVTMLPGALEKLKSLKKMGHTIIIYTSRHMKTCNGDREEVERRIKGVTLTWLKKHKVPYDEIYFGKPYGDVYLDDLGQKFSGWEQIEKNMFNSEKLNILIPMAGLGSRFKNAGFHIPKPLIQVQGKTMIEWAMKSFDFLSKIENYEIFFIVAREDVEAYDLERKLNKLFPSHTKVHVVEKRTRGQAETCLVAKDYINNHNKLIIYNCDTYSLSPLWEMVEGEDPDGILTCFMADHPRYSYAKVDKFGYVSETAEKKVISNLATTGMYYFKRGLDFVNAAETMIQKDQTFNGEFYVAPLYNQLIQQGKRIKIVLVTKNIVMGTPEELLNIHTLE